jgi:protein-disulfide isomerase
VAFLLRRGDEGIGTQYDHAQRTVGSRCCGRSGRDTQPALDAEYIKPGRVLLAFRQFPLPNHGDAEKAAEAALCAGRQGKFWEMHDRLFLDQRQLGIDMLNDRAKAIGLDLKQFRTWT